jgi:hypothetical protein
MPLIFSGFTGLFEKASTFSGVPGCHQTRQLETNEGPAVRNHYGRPAGETSKALEG